MVMKPIFLGILSPVFQDFFSDGSFYLSQKPGVSDSGAEEETPG